MMAIIGLGIDMVEIERMVRALENHRFLLRLYTPLEQEWLSGKNLLQSAAGLFAAKEAVSKALGTGFSGIHPNQIEIRHDDSGKPLVVLYKQALARMALKGGRMLVSITHTNHWAQAIAIWEDE